MGNGDSTKFVYLMTLNYFTTESNLVASDEVFEREHCYNDPEVYLLLQYHYFQTSSLKLLRKLKLNCMWSLVGKGDINY